MSLHGISQQELAERQMQREAAERQMRAQQGYIPSQWPSPPLATKADIEALDEKLNKQTVLMKALNDNQLRIAKTLDEILDAVADDADTKLTKIKEILGSE